MAKQCRFKKILHKRHYITSFSLNNTTIEKPKEKPKLKSFAIYKAIFAKEISLKRDQLDHGPNADLK